MATQVPDSCNPNHYRVSTINAMHCSTSTRKHPIPKSENNTSKTSKKSFASKIDKIITSEPIHETFITFNSDNFYKYIFIIRHISSQPTNISSEFSQIEWKCPNKIIYLMKCMLKIYEKFIIYEGITSNFHLLTPLYISIF